MKKIYKTVFILIIFVIGVLLLYLYTNSNSVNHTTVSDAVVINNNIFKVDVVKTKEEKRQGLSGRKILPENSGMLFVFEKPDIYPFWMKDMNFPIDIIWINKDLRVVYIKKSATPRSYPTIFNSKVKASYVLEVNAGEVKKNKIKIGNIVILNTHNTKQ